MNQRTIDEIIQAQPASDGDGVQLKRVFGGSGLERFDPFLMMDEFGSDKPSDYSGGFPSHPHRGFETITYMLEGHMEHQDHLGNIGDLQNGDVQWMTAGAGIIHSEMPMQTEGRLRGFQIWLNLPSAEKMQKPSWRDISAAEIPVYRAGSLEVKAIAGSLSVSSRTLTGAVTGRSTEPGLLDIRFHDTAGTHAFTVPDAHTALLYVYEGELAVGGDGTRLRAGQLARLTGSGDIVLANKSSARAILLTGRPVHEPIVSYGPFVMNTREEIEQALQDYRAGRLTQA